MKILIATDTYYPSVNGAAYFTYRLANALVQKGHTVFVICPSRSFNDTITNEKGVVVYGIRSLRIPVYQNFRMSPLAISKKSIDRVVQEISPDVVHIQNHFMIGKGVALAAKRLGISVMGTNHFMPENLVHYFHLPKFAERKLIAFGWNQCIKVFEQLDFVTTPTKTAADLLRKAGFGNEITSISCGIDLNRFNPRNDGAYLKERYNIPDRPVLLYVGRLDKEKRIEVILRALQTILKDMEVQLMLAGVGKLRIPLEIKAQEMGVRHYVTFTEFVPDEDLAKSL